MVIHCPCCHARFSLETIAQDEAARELLALRPSPAMLAYLGLFRTPARALPFDKALKLAKTALELGNPQHLELAMQETVNALRGNGGDPLKNHNYLKKVLKSVASSPLLPEEGGRGVVGAGKVSKRQQAVAQLVQWAELDWLRTAIAEGLAALVALSLENTPAADTITATADIWYHVLTTGSKLDIEDIDRPRIATAFSCLLAETGGKWPDPAHLKKLLPRRPDRAKIRHEPKTDAVAAKAHIERLRNIGDPHE
jgi:hypothetical protein